MIALTLAVLLFVAFLVKLRDVVRDPRNIGAWAVLTLLGALTFVALIRDGVPWVFGEYGTEDLGVLFRNIALTVGFGGLQLWHLHYCQVRASFARARFEAGVLVVVVVALCVITATLPESLGLAPTVLNEQSLHVQLFYRVAGVYTWYALGCQLVWNVRAAQLFRQRWLRVAVLLTAAGDLFLILAQLNRALGQAVVYATGDVKPLLLDHGETVFVVIGIPPLLVGLLFPPIVGGVRRLTAAGGQMRRYRELRSLHDAIRWAYPGMIRPDVPGDEPASAPRPVRSLRQLGFAYMERIQQCRDGYSRARGENVDGAVTRGVRLARVLRELPDTRDSGDLSDEQRETRHLIAVSRALRHKGNGWRTHPPEPATEPQSVD